MNLKDVKKIFNKFWFLLWKDDSLKGWMFSIVFIFIFVKFIFFPFLSFVTGTSLPLAIVESCSMYHEKDFIGNFDEWYKRHESKYEGFKINKEQFKNFQFMKGFNKGDILFIVRAKPEKLKIGDVIIFKSGAKEGGIIHRIIKVEKNSEGYIFSTVGDNNNGQLAPPNEYSIDETKIYENQLIGKAVFRIVPLAGWAKLILFEHLRPQSEKGFCREN